MSQLEEDLIPIRTVVNGRPVRAEVTARLLLSDWLRNERRLTGTHVGCEHGVCGACTVRLNGDPVRSCLVFAVQIDGCEVTTIEGLQDGDRLHPLQEAFHSRHGLQCGFCTPGILMTMAAFLEQHSEPTEAEVRSALGGHLCRCTGYQKIVESVLAAAAERADTP